MDDKMIELLREYLLDKRHQYITAISPKLATKEYVNRIWVIQDFVEFICGPKKKKAK